jgi:diacylglycerol kinase (ATP)
MILKYYNSEHSLVDVWEVIVNLHKDGDLIKVDNPNRKHSLKDIDNYLKESNIFKKTFINYFSLGFDARVGFGFEKSRSNSRCWNKMIYAWEGLKKNCCTKTASMNSIINTFEELELKEDNIDYNNINNNNINNKIEVLDSGENLNQIEVNNNNNNNYDNKNINSFNTTDKFKNYKKKVIFYGNDEDMDKRESKIK